MNRAASMLITLMIAGCGRVGFDQTSDVQDAAASDARACVLGDFGQATAMTELNSAQDDVFSTFTADGLEVIFRSDRPGGPGVPDLWQATRTSTSEPFGMPTLVDELSTSEWDTSPTLSSDGLTIFFARGDTARNIYRGTRTARGQPWVNIQLVDELSSPNQDGSTWLSFDDRTMYFSSTRAPSVGLDVWRADRADPTAMFEPPVRIGDISGTGEQSGTAISPDGLELLVATEALDPERFVLAHARWSGTAWVDLQEFAPTAAVGEAGFGNWSRDGRVITFSSNRPGGLGGDDFYEITRNCE